MLNYWLMRSDLFVVEGCWLQSFLVLNIYLAAWRLAQFSLYVIVNKCRLYKV